MAECISLENCWQQIRVSDWLWATLTIAESCVVMPDFGINDQGMYWSGEQQNNSNIKEYQSNKHLVMGMEGGLAGPHESLVVNSLSPLLSPCVGLGGLSDEDEGKNQPGEVLTADLCELLVVNSFCHC